MEKNNWSVAKLMNDVCNATKRYPAKVRDYISPSDIGKSYWDRYQKMMGVEPTNPFPDRLLRVFAAGDNVHMIMVNVFKAAGILINKEEWVEIPATTDRLKMLGRYDVLAGGKADEQAVEKYCREVGFNDFFTEKAIQLAKEWNKQYPNGANFLLYEFKSVNSQVFWSKKEYLQQAYPWHALQCYAYLKGTGVSEGRVFYVSKDDWTTVEFPIYLNDPKLEEAYQKDIMEMSAFVLNKQEPPKPELIVFDKRKKIKFQQDKKKYEIEGCYAHNWEIERSQYFTLLTGEKKFEDWLRKIKPEIDNRNAGWKDDCIKNNNYKLIAGAPSKLAKQKEDEKV